MCDKIGFYFLILILTFSEYDVLFELLFIFKFKLYLQFVLEILISFFEHRFT